MIKANAETLQCIMNMRRETLYDLSNKMKTADLFFCLFLVDIVIFSQTCQNNNA